MTLEETGRPEIISVLDFGAQNPDQILRKAEIVTSIIIASIFEVCLHGC